MQAQVQRTVFVFELTWPCWGLGFGASKAQSAMLPGRSALECTRRMKAVHLFARLHVCPGKQHETAVHRSRGRVINALTSCFSWRAETRLPAAARRQSTSSARVMLRVTRRLLMKKDRPTDGQQAAPQQGAAVTRSRWLRPTLVRGLCCCAAEVQATRWCSGALITCWGVERVLAVKVLDGL